MRELSTLQVNTGSTFEGFCPFPVGYIYQSTDSTSPADLYGGTWSALTDGRFLRPSNSWNRVGGENTHYHWTTVGYSYPEDIGYIGGYQSIGNASYSRTKIAGHRSIANPPETPTVGLYRENSTYGASSLPPYRTCYAWYRTA